jgi:hypothetical protein
VIVRIPTEGQYELGEDDVEELNQLDGEVLSACERGDDAAFKAAFGRLVEFVHAHAKPVGDDYLGGSDVILPTPDATLEEAKVEITGEGLIPG